MWIVAVALALQPALILPFIHSPSRGNGCLGRLLWPWGAWLSLWSLLPGTDCPRCAPGPQPVLPNFPKLPVYCPPWLRCLLWVGGARIEGHIPQQAGRTETLKQGHGVQPKGRGPVPPDPVVSLLQPCPLGSGLSWGSLSFPSQ